MHIGALKKMALALTFWLALHGSQLKAQILLGPYSNSNASVGVDAYGLLSATGTFEAGSLSLSGSGLRMFWYPGKGAFRAGFAVGTNWDDTNIGTYSVAFGNGTTASGEGATAFDTGTKASGNYSMAFGHNTTASGEGATAFGFITTASGEYATAFGFDTTATSYWSTASGYGTTASGPSSMAFGVHTNASGSSSTASGYKTTASGYASTSFGVGSTASGYYSTASGLYTTAKAYNSFVTGAFNVGLAEDGVTAPSPTTWVSTDPLFEIGNGHSSSGYAYGNPAFTGPADAFVVYKDGNAKLQGTLTTAQGGDIPMYTGH